MSGAVTVKDHKFVMPAGDVTVRAIFETSAYTFVTPTMFELTPFAEWTTLQFDMSYLNFAQVGGDRTPERFRLVLGYTDGTALTLKKRGDSSKTIPFFLSNANNTQILRNHRTLDWNTANSPQNMYLYTASSAWNNAESGTYEVELPYHFMWYYSTTPRWSSDFGFGFIYITVTVPERHTVTVTADPPEGGTVSGAGVYEVGDTVTLGAQANQNWTFSGWQVVSGDATIENGQFTVQHEDVAVKAVFEPRSIPYVDAQGAAQMPVTGFSDISADTTTLKNGWYVVEQDVTVSRRITVIGNINLLLCNGATLTAHRGIDVSQNNTKSEPINSNSLTIWQQAPDESRYTGRLVIDDWQPLCAGIGGGMLGFDCGAVTVNGGDIRITTNPENPSLGAGIGGGEGGSAGTITINGGSVYIDNTISGSAAGIGSGNSNIDGGTITINGGTVNVPCAYQGTGIGDENTTIILNWTEASKATMSVTAGSYTGGIELQNSFIAKSESSPTEILYPTHHIEYLTLDGKTLVPAQVGDANLDGRVNVRDVTAIQRHIADLELLSEDALPFADTNGDGFVTIADATRLQMYLAEFDVVLGAHTIFN